MARTASEAAVVDAPLVVQPARRRRGVLLVAWLLFVVLLLVLTLGVAEIGLRIRRDRVAAHLPDPPATDGRFLPDRLLGYTNKPNISYTSESRRHLVFHYSNNSLGLRGAETGRTPAPGVQRVIVVGGSTVYGALDDQDDTLPVELEQVLRERYGANVEVLNAGIPGYEALREAAYTKADLLDLQPDVVVVMDGLNDVFYGSLEEWPSQIAEYQLRIIGDGRLPELSQTIDRTMFPHGVLEHQVTMLARTARMEIFPLLLHRSSPPAPRIANERVEDLHAASVGRMVEYARSRGARTVASLQPLLVLGSKPLSADEEEAVRHEDYWDPEGWPAIARVMYPRMDTTTRAAVEAAGGRYLDLRHAFDTEPGTAYAEDVAHYTGLGNQRLAEALAPTVLDLLQQPPAR
jgi:GDSL-like lipase/acylhydrolase family protein